MSTQNNSAKFAFFYMLSLVALGFFAYSVGAIIFQMINKNIPDLLSTFSGKYSTNALKFAISAVIVAGPIYYLMMWQIGKNLFKGFLKKDSGVRKWLTYLILLVSAIVAIGWLIAIVYNFLDGDLTTKLILKALTAIVIAAVVFVFYLYDIKREETEGKKSLFIKIYFWITLVVSVAILVSSFFFVESPAEARNKRHDQLISEHLMTIDNSVQIYSNNENMMPESLDTITTYKFNSISADNTQDPITGQKFEYKTTGKDTYEICASFTTSTLNQSNSLEEYYYDQKWRHDQGRYCFSRKVEKINKNFAPVPVN